MRLEISVCDDEKAEREYLASLISRWAETAGHTVTVKDYSSAEQFLFENGEDVASDILLLDIQMKQIDGVQLARAVRSRNKTVQIVFITGFDEYVSLGYDVDALHYLMKPVGYEKLAEVLNRAAERVGKKERQLLLQTADGLRRLAVGDVVYAEAVGHTLIVHLNGGTVALSRTLASFKEDAGEGFVSPHRSFLVNLSHISRISKKELGLDNGETVPVARGAYDEVNRAFIAFYRRA
ncbi:MAG: response regulator transcription factor [Clostridia bacterium]|nr:response regulator transcription factor [Clostridia bacterium]